MTRQFDFTVGPETSEQPTIGTPSSDDDLITRGYADGRYTQGSEAVANIAAIKAILAADRADGDVIAELTNNRLYIFDSGSSATGDDDLVLTPDAGTGRWLAITPHNPGDKIDVANDVTGTLPVANGGTGVTSSTGSGSVVLSNSPALTTPNIGTPSAATLTNATGLPIDAGSTGTLPINRGGTGQTTQTAGFDALSPTTTKGDIIADDGTNAVRVAVGADGLILKADSTASAGVSWGSASSGSGEINYIDNPDAEANTTGWATYADAAGATPVDGTGGSPNVTWTRQSSVILRGNQTFKLTKDAANRQGEGVSYDFSIKEQDISKKLKIQFDFKTNEDAAYASGDLTVYIYDVTNAQLITPVDTDIIDGQNIFQTSFNSTTSTSYRLIFHVATTNASAWDAYIDNVIVGPGMTSQGAAIGPIETYTLSNSNITNDAGLTITGQMSTQRVGDNLLVFGQLAFTGTGTDAGALSLDLDTILPSPLTIISGRYGNATQDIFNSTSTSRYAVSGHILADGTDSIQFTRTPGSGIGLRGNQFGDTGVLRDNLIFSGSLPITTWAGKGIVPMLAEDNLSEPVLFTPSWSNIGTTSQNAGSYSRVGSYMEGEAYFIASGAGSGGAITLTIPGGLNIDTAKLSAGGPQNGRVIGTGAYIDSGTTTKGLWVTYSDSTSIFMIKTGEILDSIDGPEIASGDELGIKFRVPILEWAGSQNSLVGYAQASGGNLGLVSSYSANVQSSILHVNSANYTVLTNDGYRTIRVTTGSSDRTITLPSASANVGRIITIVREDAPTSGLPSIIINDATATLVTRIGYRYDNTYNGQGASITLQSDGSVWKTIATTGDYIYSTSTTSWSTSTQNANTISVPPGVWKFEVFSYRSAGTADTNISVSLSTTSATHNGSVGKRTYTYFSGTNGFATTQLITTEVVTSNTTFYHCFNTANITGGSTGNHYILACRER